MIMFKKYLFDEDEDLYIIVYKIYFMDRRVINIALLKMCT